MYYIPFGPKREQLSNLTDAGRGMLYREFWEILTKGAGYNDSSIYSARESVISDYIANAVAEITGDTNRD